MPAVHDLGSLGNARLNARCILAGAGAHDDPDVGLYTSHTTDYRTFFVMFLACFERILSWRGLFQFRGCWGFIRPKLGDARGKWLLTREDEVLLLGDSVMIPDFAFTHKEDGRRALVEIVGFWHPEYLRRKLAKVRAAGRDDLILLVYEGVNLTDDKLQDVPGEVLYFASRPVIKQVIAAVERRAR